jgi:hypothetical protein
MSGGVLNINNQANIEASGLSVTEPTTAGTPVTGESTGTVNIPAGARFVEIENVGFKKSGDAAGDITVNGDAWSVGRKHRFQDEFREQPAFEIISTGSRFFYSYQT